MTTKLNPYLAILVGATLGGSSGVFIKLLDLPSTSITFFRVGIPVLVLTGYFLWKKKPFFPGNRKLMFLASGLNALRIFLFFVGYLYTTIGNAVIMLYTWPLFATLFGLLFLREKVSLRTALLIGLAFIGIVTMYAGGEALSADDMLGMGAMLVSAMVFSITAVIYKKELTTQSRTHTIFYQNIIGAVVFLPFLFNNDPLPSAIQFSVASLYGFLVGIVAFLLFFYALKQLTMSHYSLFTYWEVPSALIFGVVFFGESLTINMLIGGTLIITSGLLLRKKPEEPPD